MLCKCGEMGSYMLLVKANIRRAFQKSNLMIHIKSFENLIVVDPVDSTSWNLF